MAFVKAVRKQAKLRLALTGPSGSGKTYSAILLAQGLGGKVAVIDTEHGSASLYCDLMEFDVLELTAPYSPERYVAAIKEAESAGYDTLIIDSITHEWNGTGGMLQINEKLAASKFKGNTWSAWSESDPRHRAFLDAILQAKMHVIVTMRSKTDTASEKDSNGKTKIVQLGMKAEQRDGIIYEFTTVLDLVHGGHFATATKDRTGVFSGDPQVITPATGAALIQWLNTGVEQEVFDDGVFEGNQIGMMGAETMEELKELFSMAYTYAKRHKNAEAMAAAKTVYEGRKAELEAPQEEVSFGEQA